MVKINFICAAVFLSILYNTSPVKSSKILAVAFFSSKSHKIVYEPLLHELGKRGHEVTVLTPIRATKEVKNVRDILTVDIEPRLSKMANWFELKEKGIMWTSGPFAFITIIEDLCRDTYDLPQVKALMNEKFDLIIAQPVMNDCAMGFVSHFKAPLVLISPISSPNFLTTYTGTPALHAFSPNPMSPYTDEMTFYQRMMNMGINALWSGLIEWVMRPRAEAIYREKLGNPNAPSVDEILSNVSLILSNGHFSMGRPKAYLPDVVEVGGMHCREAKELPKDLDDYLSKSSAPDGFIYFSMGSALQAHTMPEKYRQIFISTFAKLNQKVLWKWETEKMEDLPGNVKLGKWLPQQDILGHPNIKMFITHGGLGSTAEAVFHGAPLLGIPMAGDQMLNMQQSENAGFALTVELLELTEEKLMTGILRILNEKSFKENVEKLSSRFRDQPDKPLDRAVFWTEYVLRHKGALHMRSAGRQLNFFQYHSIDVFAAYGTIVLLIVGIVFAIIRFIVKKICCRKSKKSDKGKKNN